MRRPTRVRNAAGTGHRHALDRALQTPDTARELARDEATVGVNGEPRRVVATILEASQPSEQNRSRRYRRRSRHAHMSVFLSRKMPAGGRRLGLRTAARGVSSPTRSSWDCFSSSSLAMSSASNSVPHCEQRRPLIRSAPQTVRERASAGRVAPRAPAEQRRHFIPCRNTIFGPLRPRVATAPKCPRATPFLDRSNQAGSAPVTTRTGSVTPVWPSCSSSVTIVVPGRS